MSEKTYTYEPTQICDKGLNQMRFTLGDTAIEGGEATCPLCDEEYNAMIENAKTFKQAKIACLSAIVAKLAYEVDYSADGLSFSLSQRFKRWEDMLKALKKSGQVPTANPAALGVGRADGGHYFYTGMLNNPKAAGSE